MQVTNNPTTPSTGSAASSGSATTQNPVDALANEQTFLQLLVAQIQNQDPMNPTDSTQFVTQLAQFSSLEQLININQGVSTINTDLTSGSTNQNPTTGSTGN